MRNMRYELYANKGWEVRTTSASHALAWLAAAIDAGVLADGLCLFNGAVIAVPELAVMLFKAIRFE